MQQSNVIFAYVLIAFMLFISLRGELSTYITLLRGGGEQPAAAGGSGGGGGSSSDSFLSDAASIAQVASFFL